MTQAWRLPLPPNHKIVLLALCDWADDEGSRVYPSMETLAKKSSMSKRSAQRIVHDLIDQNFLSVVGNENGGAGKSRQYSINVQTLQDALTDGLTHKKGDSLSSLNHDEKGDTEDQKDDSQSIKGDTQDQKGDTAVTLTVISTKEPSITTSDDGFDDFWKVYPRKDAKLAAQRSYRTALKRASSQEILNGAKLYAENSEGKEEKFIKVPTTWLNGGCWANYEISAPTKGDISSTLPPEIVERLRCHPKITMPVIKRWFELCTFDIDAGTITAPTAFAATWIQRDYDDALAHVFGRHMKIMSQPAQRPA